MKKIGKPRKDAEERSAERCRRGVITVFLFFIFCGAASAELSLCNFGADPYLKEGRALMPYEKILQSTSPVELAMLGGKHRESQKARPYRCIAPAGTEFITIPDPQNLGKRVATEVFPCFNPIVNMQWGLGRVVFNDTAEAVPSPKKLLTESELYGSSEAPKRHRLEKKTGKYAFWTSVIAVAAASVASYKHRDGYLVPLFVGPIAGGVGGFFEGDRWSWYDVGIGFGVGATGGLITHASYPSKKAEDEAVVEPQPQQPTVGQDQPIVPQQPPVGQNQPQPTTDGQPQQPPVGDNNNNGGNNSSNNSSSGDNSQPSVGDPPPIQPIINAAGPIN